MSYESEENQRSSEIREKIARLRRRLEGHVELPELRNVIKGILDLLGDEL